jgi:hypothetical protein
MFQFEWRKLQIAHEVSNWLGIARREPGKQDRKVSQIPRSSDARGGWPRLLILRALPTQRVPRSSAFFAKGGNRKCLRRAGLIP